MKDGTQRPTSAVEGDETRLLALFFDLCRLTQRAHKTRVTRGLYALLIDPYSEVPNGWIYFGPRFGCSPQVRQRGVPGECIWSLIFHRRTHDAAVKQSEGPGSLPLTAFRQLLSLGEEDTATGRLEDAILCLYARNISLTTCPGTQLPAVLTITHYLPLPYLEHTHYTWTSDIT